jgi:hypothetical protein
MNPLYLLLTATGLLLTYLAWQKSQKDGFFTLTQYLAPLGIYVWGDALVLGPFWALSGLVFHFLTPVNILRYLFLFYALRSAYEVIYWLNHQAVKDQYRPPLLPPLKNLNPKEAAILYQLVQFLLTFLFSATLLYTFLKS